MIRRSISVLSLIVLLAVVSFAAGDKKMTIEDSLAIKNVGSPQWSPDGKWLAYTVSEWNKKENRRDTHIYIISASGGSPVKLTNGERGESSPQWSPDGSRIAFLANREQAQPGSQQGGGRGNQIWVISVSGGEAEKITDEETAVSQFRWSPDGKSIAYVIRDVPKDKAEREKRKKDKFDTIVVDSDYTYSHLWVMNLDSKQKKRATEGSFSISDPQWSPDSKWIAYTVSRSGAQESSFTDISEDRNTDIFVVASTGGQSRQLTSNPGPDSSPRWSPDGKHIAYSSNGNPESWAEKSDLMVIAVEGGNPRNLTASYHDSVFGIEWSPDNSAVYTTGSVGVYNQLFKVPVSGGAPQPVFEKPAAIAGFDLSPDSRQIAYLNEDAKNPGDIWIASSTGRDARRITNTNPQIKEFALADMEVIRWKAPDGLEIEGILVKPISYESGKSYPTILQIHGGPYGRFSYGFNSRAHIWAANGYAVLMPNPRGSTGYGNKFTTANLLDWGGKDYQDLMAGVDEVIRLKIADPNRLAVMGGSYGGFMTFWVITQTDRFKAAIGHAGISDWYSFHGQSDIPGLMEYGFGGVPWTARDTYVKYSPMTYVNRVKTPLLITHGEQDRRVTIAQAEQYYRGLRKRGVHVVFLRYPREGHGIQEPNHQIDLVTRQLEWFEKLVKSNGSQAAGASAKQN
ncbi:MAG TPA: S9 family peptidase [Blastocatellia bacterium]|nr:S9 family peptidase [Blastocatellia bacterium]